MCCLVGRKLLRQASLSHLTRAAAEARTQSMRAWITSHVRASRRYRPPRGAKIYLEPRKERKELVGRFYQLLSGHASIGAYLAGKAHTIKPSECCWCGCVERQSRHHLFAKCRAWAIQIREPWRSIAKACERKHPRAPSIRLLLQDETPRLGGDRSSAP